MNTLDWLRGQVIPGRHVIPAWLIRREPVKSRRVRVFFSRLVHPLVGFRSLVVWRVWAVFGQEPDPAIPAQPQTQKNLTRTKPSQA